jgi:hypothetical protein
LLESVPSMRCTLEAKKIAIRGGDIGRLLSPLAAPKRRFLCPPHFMDRRVVISAALSATDSADPNPDQWRFATRIPGIRASYHEVWLPTDFRQGDFYLDRAYLSLYIRRDERTEEEILALHCDPNEPASSKHYRYKVGPHIHMTTVEDPLPHTHLALNAANFDAILRSAEELTKSLSVAVAMVNDQVLGLYEGRTIP